MTEPVDPSTIGADLVNHAAWADMDRIHRIFAWLRDNDPVHRAEVEGYPTFYHLTRHADLLEVESRREVFLNEPRLIMQTLDYEEGVKQQTGGTTYTVKSLVTMDGKEHRNYRYLTNAWFQPRSLQQLNDAIESLAAESVERLLAHGGSFDFARDVAVWYPLKVIMSILGVPDEDLPLMLRLTQELFGANDPDLAREGGTDVQATMQDYLAYFNAITEDRRRSPRGDVATLIANAEIDGEPIGPREAIGYYIILATAGHDTTSYSISEALHQLALQPGLLEALKADPEGAAVAITEEALRYAAPVRHFVRTASEDYQLDTSKNSNLLAA